MRYVVLMAVFALANITFSQDKSFTALGLALIAEGQDAISPTYGLSLEHKATKHSGFETGVYYRDFKQRYSYFYPSVSGGRQFHDSTLTYLSIPLLYKFYSKVVNFEVGVTADFYLAGERLVFFNQSDVRTEAKKVYVPKARAGIMLKLGKSINLGERLVIEPELRVNTLLESIEVYGPNTLFVGLGMGIKYKFGIKEEPKSEDK